MLLETDELPNPRPTNSKKKKPKADNYAKKKNVIDYGEEVGFSTGKKSHHIVIRCATLS